MDKKQPAEQQATCTNSDSWNCKYCNKTKTCAALAAGQATAAQAVAEPVTWMAGGTSTAADGKTELFNIPGYPLMVRAVDFNRIHAESEMRRAALLDEMQ